MIIQTVPDTFWVLLFHKNNNHYKNQCNISKLNSDSSDSSDTSINSGNCNNIEKSRKLKIKIFLLTFCCHYIMVMLALQIPAVVLAEQRPTIMFLTDDSVGQQKQQPKPITLPLINKPMALINDNNAIISEKIAAIKDKNFFFTNNNHENFDEDYDTDDDDNSAKNSSVKGLYIGASCEFTCNPRLHHVFCDPTSNTCGCEKNYPVIIHVDKGCAKPKKLGEQCFYDETCTFNDVHSSCVQVSHNAICQCASGYHSVSYIKPTKRVFCTQDLEVITSDLPTLLGVSTGIAVLAGLICMVLHLFSKTKYPRSRHYGDANLPPPIMYSSDTGNSIPLTVQSARPSSRSSLRSSGSISSYGNRRPSSAPAHQGSKGVLVSTSRTGSRRPSLASIHSTSSSVRSYSIMRFEKELQQKELRQEMKHRLAKLQHQPVQQQSTQLHYSQMRPQITIGDSIHYCSTSKSALPTPSPMTPNSTDELLPSVEEIQEVDSKGYL